MSPAAPSTADPLLRVERLSTHFRQHHRTVRAVADVSLEVARGRTLGLVGESGCGKSTLARSILRLTPATAGRVWFDGVDLLTLSPGALRRLRPRLQIVFQDPVESLNPRLRVERIVGEALRVHGRARSRREVRERVAELLPRVGLRSADVDAYPHQFSGGQRQRIGIARALALEPDLLICDEPVSALDVSIRSQILNLLVRLQRELGLASIFIAHDLAVVRHVCDDVAVMYLGRIVEQAPAEALFRRPLHPYTRALLAAAPDAGRRGAALELPIVGEPPSPLDPPAGCAFHPRCPLAEPRCRRERPPLRATGAGHSVACHLA